jgi:ABC-type multidrug transport system ATPase subunit|tara:strand:+ start:30694 stop:33759 length:3066 start_codon:yes stop_codon:yes gene_type:complete
MSERILRALMQLFAILARVDESEETLNKIKFESTTGRQLVEDYLQTELSTSLVEHYLQIFDNDLQTLHQSTFKKDGKSKRTSVNSVKILRICSQINKELTQKQKVLVLIRVMEFVLLNQSHSKQEIDFVETVADSFNIEKTDYERIMLFIENSIETHIDDGKTLFITGKPIFLKRSKNILLPNLDAEIRILKIDESNNLYFRYLGNDQLFLNGQIISNKRIQTFSTGSSLKTSKSNQLYYSDIISQFLNNRAENELDFSVNKLSYIFPNRSYGLHELSFQSQDGKLIGIMGGSGSGKSTLLNILNGKIKPTTGSIKINGVDLTTESEKLEGIIGFISQDDVLFEDLTVYENLFFNAQLCFKDLDKLAIQKKVVKILLDVGLFDVRELKVGSPSEKVISGGQRKRLNIALELIREPAILFVDEPTSGLSSRDSENIMDLMKELTLQGKLIFVVIHQPSSEIFKMFDRLFLLDKGGYPIFDGNPTDSIVYFKLHVNHAGAEERECPQCGNVNPEQIFNIVESKVVNEEGLMTNLRKTEPQEWYEKYKKVARPLIESEERKELIGGSKKPNKFEQFKVFLKRDALSKLSNKQYLVVNFLEAPFLALLLAFVLRYFGNENENGELIYSFYHNENIPQYIFIANIVAVFMGLTVAAEEIFRDKQILERESFLNLSKSSYLLSKIGVLFLISAIQTLSFVIVGNSIMEIKGMWLDYWFVLFSISCTSNLVGLIISASFNSVKVIYILVPLLIIPQLLFTGIIVKFDKLNPALASQKEVPFIGDLISCRWSFEAIAVQQQVNNPINSKLLTYKIEKFQSAWKRDYWIPEMKELIMELNNPNKSKIQKKIAKTILLNEIEKEETVWNNFECEDCKENINSNDDYLSANYFLLKLQQQYKRQYDQAVLSIEKFVTETGNVQFAKIENEYINENLRNLLTNREEYNKIMRYNGELIQKVDQIFQDSPSNGIFSSPLYSPYKYLFGIKLPTFWANLFVIWIMSLLLYFLLYFDMLSRFFAIRNLPMYTKKTA